MEIGRSEYSSHGNKVMPGNDPHVLEVVRQAHEELRQLMRQRADVMKRIATPMVGGVITSTVMELLVYPAIFYLWRSRGLGRTTEPLSSAPALETPGP